MIVTILHILSNQTEQIEFNHSSSEPGRTCWFLAGNNRTTFEQPFAADIRELEQARSIAFRFALL